MNKKSLTQIESKFNMYSALYILFALAGYFAFGIINIGSFSILEWFKFIPLIMLGIEYTLYFIFNEYKNYKVMTKSLSACFVGFIIEGILYIGKMIINHFNFISIKSYSFFLSFLLSFLILFSYYIFYMIRKMKEEKNYKKNIIITLIPAILFVLLFVISNINPFVTKKSDDGVEIVGFLPLSINRKNIEIPDKIRGKNVVGIRNQAFKYNQEIETLKISSEVRKIDEEAFRMCGSLKEVEFSNNSKLTYIGEGSFKTCISLEVFDMPISVKYIGKEAFCGCGFDVDFSTLEDLEFIGDSAFELCYGLKRIELNSDKLNYLGSSSFCETTVESLVFSDKINLDLIDEYAFANCYYLRSISFNHSNIKNIGMRAFLNSVSLEEVRFNDNLETIEFASFGGSGLLRVYMNNGFVNATGNPFGEFNKVTYNYTSIKTNIKIFINGDNFDNYIASRGYSGYEDCFEFYK